jgi:hypothetical protein
MISIVPPVAFHSFFTTGVAGGIVAQILLALTLSE